MFRLDIETLIFDYDLSLQTLHRMPSETWERRPVIPTFFSLFSIHRLLNLQKGWNWICKNRDTRFAKRLKPICKKGDTGVSLKTAICNKSDTICNFTWYSILMDVKSNKSPKSPLDRFPLCLCLSASALSGGNNEKSKLVTCSANNGCVYVVPALGRSL